MKFHWLASPKYIWEKNISWKSFKILLGPADFIIIFITIFLKKNKTQRASNLGTLSWEIISSTTWAERLQDSIMIKTWMPLTPENLVPRIVDHLTMKNIFVKKNLKYKNMMRWRKSFYEMVFFSEDIMTPLVRIISHVTALPSLSLSDQTFFSMFL